MMSNSGEEEHLSTPTEESIEDVEKNQDDVPIQDNRKNSSASKSKVKVVPNSNCHSQSKKNMTRSSTPERDRDHRGVPSDDPKISRRFAQINEENAVLKRQLKKQEERLKVLATKLIRVISEKSNKSKREEILLDEQKARIADLEHEVSNLRDKLLVSKQQLTSYTRLIPHHPMPPSRQASSMLSSSTATTSHSKLKKPRSARSNSGGASIAGSQPPRPSTATSSRGNLLIDKNFADRVEELLLEAKAENQALEDQLKNCRQRLTSTEEEFEKVKAELKSKEAEHQEEILKIKSQLGKEQDVAKKKKQLSDNIQLIRLQRESRRTASWLSTLEAQCLALESRLAAATENAGQLETQLSEAQEELGQEQQKNINLQKQMEDATSSLSRLKELEAQIDSLQEENKILKEANESLLKKAFSVTEKVEKAESTEISMKVQMSHLETVLKSEMKSKQDLMDSLRTEKEKSVRLEMTNEKLQEALDKMNEEMLKYKMRPSSPSKKSSLSSEDKHHNVQCGDCPHLIKMKELEEELNSVKSQLNALSNDHDRARLTLRNQLATNEEYKREIESLTAKLDKADEFHHNKLQDFVQVLEERTRQISHLEQVIDEWKYQQASKQQDSCQVCGNCLKKNVQPEVVLVVREDSGGGDGSNNNLLRGQGQMDEDQDHAYYEDRPGSVAQVEVGDNYTYSGEGEASNAPRGDEHYEQEDDYDNDENKDTQENYDYYDYDHTNTN